MVELKRSDQRRISNCCSWPSIRRTRSSRIVALPKAKSEYLDLRLAKGLDPKSRHYTQQKQITVLPTGGTLVVPDITSTHFEEYDSVARVYALYTAHSNDPKFAEFRFIKDWPSLKPEQKRDMYRKYASHELHFFLYKKDPQFFKTAILPYLANKKEKQFLDHWLLGDDLHEYLKPWNFEQLNTWERICSASAYLANERRGPAGPRSIRFAAAGSGSVRAFVRHGVEGERAWSKPVWELCSARISSTRRRKVMSSIGRPTRGWLGWTRRRSRRTRRQAERVAAKERWRSGGPSLVPSK